MNRRQMVGAIAALPLLTRPAAFASAATAAMPLAKMISFVASRSDIAAERFRMLWIGKHARTGARSPNVAGLVLSEVLQGGEASPGTPYPFAIEGIETAWMTTADVASGSVLAADPGGGRDAGATVIDASVSRRFMVTEQVVVPPLVREGAVRRTLLMVRKEGLAHDDFMERWTIGHARLAADVPGLLGCVFNHILPMRNDAGTSTPAIDGPAIDGIAELWWEGTPDHPGTRVVTPQADVWLADGDTFTDRERTRVLVSLDHVIIPPPAA